MEVNAPESRLRQQLGKCVWNYEEHVLESMTK